MINRLQGQTRFVYAKIHPLLYTTIECLAIGRKLPIAGKNQAEMQIHIQHSLNFIQLQYDPGPQDNCRLLFGDVFVWKIHSVLFSGCHR